jgi:SAM-dependent methyltransferase
MDEAHWEAWAAQTELEGEVLLAFVTDTAARVAELRGPDAPPVRRVLDIGSGPGVGTCELAMRFPRSEVIAVDGSPAMLERAIRRAADHGLHDRISAHLAELPDGLDGLERADVIWASLSLHHVGDEVAALRLLGGLLEPSGLLAVAEMAEPMRLLPDDLGIGRPGLVHRLEDAGSTWFAAMREGLPGSVPSAELTSMVTSAGLEVVDQRLARHRIDPPLADDARRFMLGHLRRTRGNLDDRLDEDDLHTLDVLIDADDPRSVMHRSDVFVAASRQIVIARPVTGR